MSDKVYLKTNPDIVFREEETGAFLFNSNNCVLKGLNDTGRIIWTLCDGTRTEEEILKDVFLVFPEIGDEVLHEDIRAFIKQLQEIKYIERVKG